MDYLKEICKIQDDMIVEAQFLERLALAFGITGNRDMEKNLAESAASIRSLKYRLDDVVDWKLSNDLAEARKALFGGMKATLEVMSETKEKSGKEME